MNCPETTFMSTSPLLRKRYRFLNWSEYKEALQTQVKLNAVFY